MRGERPLYTVVASRHRPAPTELSPPQLVARPSCLIIVCVVVALLTILSVALAVEFGRTRSSFKQP